MLGCTLDLASEKGTKARGMVVLFIVAVQQGVGGVLSGCQGSALLSRGDAGELRSWGQGDGKIGEVM